MIFKTIAFFLIALLGIGFLLAIISEFAPNWTGPIICRLYQTGLALMPVSDAMKPSLPWYCLQNECKYRRIRLLVKSNADLSKELANYMLKCWECSKRGKKSKTFICFELYSEMETDERMVTEWIRDMGMCNILPNNRIDFNKHSFDCGGENKIYWEGQKVTETIIIKYDAFTHRLVVS